MSEINSVGEIIDSVAIVGYAIGGYLATLLGAQLIGHLTSQKIRSQEELDKIVEEEADKLGMDKRTLISKFYSTDDKEYSDILGARCFIEDFDFEEHIIPMKVVEIKEGWGARRHTVRHELYHLLKHLPRKRGLLKYLFYEEPTATIYAITGIKL